MEQPEDRLSPDNLMIKSQETAIKRSIDSMKGVSRVLKKDMSASHSSGASNKEMRFLGDGDIQQPERIPSRASLRKLSGVDEDENSAAENEELPNLASGKGSDLGDKNVDERVLDSNSDLEDFQVEKEIGESERVSP